MAEKTIILFVGSESTYGLNGELSPAKQALASPAAEEEAMHIATTPLAILPAPGRKMAPRGAEEEAADPLVRPNQGGGPRPPLRHGASSRRPLPRGAGEGAQGLHRG